MSPSARVALFVISVLFHLLRPAACGQVGCAPAAVDKLRDRLGPAFNPRYMSIDKPPPEPEEPARIYARHTDAVQSDASHAEGDASNLQGDHRTPSFRVDPEFMQDVVEGEIDADPSLRAQRNDKSIDVKPSGVPSKKLLWLEKAVSRGDIKDSEQAQRPPSRELGDLRGSRGRREDDTRKPWGCESRIVWQDLGEDRFPRFLRTVHCKGEPCWFTHFRCQGRAFTVKVLRRANADAPCTDGVRTSLDHLPAGLRENWVFEERAVTFCCDCSSDD
ncbi:hypothetical protein V5799_031300 [Amblyomma americanum]|uniref:Protein trunk n=1 Tax=Amblyomma americanum TaxID=6943 RepID=A0AAQ4ELP5_AMBAM